MREYTCTQCKTVFRRPAASSGLNAFCTTKCRKEFHGFKKHNKALGRDDKVMREFPAELSVAPLRSLGAA